MRKILMTLIVVCLPLLLSCSGGGGVGVIGAASPSSINYQAGLSIGDNGQLCLNTNSTTVLATENCPELAPLSYSLNITQSSFGLVGQSFTGAISENGDGSYHIVGTAYGTIFVYPTYSILTLEMDPTNPIYSTYFSINSNITTITYVPIFAVNSNNLLSSTDQITSRGNGFDYREVSMSMSIAGGNTTYLSEASHGTVIPDVNNQGVFTVQYCSNDGISANDSNLTATNCVGGLVNTLTFTYDSATKAWLVTPVDPSHSSQVIRAYFVADVMTDSVVGYIDTSDSSQTSSKFAYVSIVPVGTNSPSLGNGTATFTSYQLCSSDSNCGGMNGLQGVFYTDSLTTSFGSTGSSTRATTGWNVGCNVTNTLDYYSPGFSANFYTAGSGLCNTSGYRPDTVAFFIGSRQINGKASSLMATAGWDSTTSPIPSQTLAIAFLKMN
jgi:hypothetical protein